MSVDNIMALKLQEVEETGSETCSHEAETEDSGILRERGMKESCCWIEIVISKKINGLEALITIPFVRDMTPLCMMRSEKAVSCWRCAFQ